MYKTRMSSDFFTIKGLETRTGLEEEDWSLAIIKEIIDNALDAIEAESKKEINIEYADNTVRIFDNGAGLSVQNIKDIYDFENYVSRNRHHITGSRGKQGNGLKSIIGICYIKQYQLLWHTSSYAILKVDFDASAAEDTDLEINFISCGLTDKTGIEIRGFDIIPEELNYIIWQYSVCNPDVNFNIVLNNAISRYPARKEPVNKSSETSLAFYCYEDLLRLIRVQEKSITYKSFLCNNFGKRVSDNSQIKNKIEHLDLTEVKEDFTRLKDILKAKPYTLLSNHLLGFSDSIKTTVRPEEENNNLNFPCLVEFEINKLSEENSQTAINCYVNNSITYFDGGSIVFDYRQYKISNTRKSVWANNLDALLEDYKDYYFKFHIIAPYLKFKDYGKTEINISDFIGELVDALRKAIEKEKRRYDAATEKRPTQKSLAKRYMTEAFMLASSDSKYAVTARQIYYKLRELIGRAEWEKESTYSSFTQDWLTEWLEENEEYESKVNFSDRGNFYVEGSQEGLGTANVRRFIDDADLRTDKFSVHGGLQDTIYIDDADFGIQYKYDKVLYIEKTGFDSVFKAERLDEKYNLLIVSGQGYASRAARRLLYDLQERGLKLYCLHDLDIDGVTIYNSMCRANNKFEYDLIMENLGITVANVERNGIEPELVAATKTQKAKLLKLPYEYRDFFDSGEYHRRVELNAFSTEQLLKIIDDKFSGKSALPTIKISESLELDNRALREVAFMRVMRSKYHNFLEGISLDIKLSQHDGLLTLPEAKAQIPGIKETVLSEYENEILRLMPD